MPPFQPTTAETTAAAPPGGADNTTMMNAYFDRLLHSGTLNPTTAMAGGAGGLAAVGNEDQWDLLAATGTNHNNNNTGNTNLGSNTDITTEEDLCLDDIYKMSGIGSTNANATFTSQSLMGVAGGGLMMDNTSNRGISSGANTSNMTTDPSTQDALLLFSQLLNEHQQNAAAAAAQQQQPNLHHGFQAAAANDASSLFTSSMASNNTNNTGGAMSTMLTPGLNSSGTNNNNNNHLMMMQAAGNSMIPGLPNGMPFPASILTAATADQQQQQQQQQQPAFSLTPQEFLQQQQQQLAAAMLASSNPMNNTNTINSGGGGQGQQQQQQQTSSSSSSESAPSVSPNTVIPLDVLFGNNANKNIAALAPGTATTTTTTTSNQASIKAASTTPPGIISGNNTAPASAAIQAPKPPEIQSPLRALSAYNFFFRDERERILAGKSASDEDDYSDAKQQQLLRNHWDRDRTVKRRHRKSHGKISFANLSKSISKNWKSLPEDRKIFYREVASKDWERYHRELTQHKLDLTAAAVAETLKHHPGGQSFQQAIG